MQTAEPTLGDTSIVAHSVTNSRCAPHVGAQEISGGLIKTFSASALPQLQIVSDATEAKAGVDRPVPDQL